MSVRHIHTQAQALAELERERAAKRASYARRKERTLKGTPAEAQAELERERAAQRASYARRKERRLNGPPAEAQAELERQRAAQKASRIRRKERILNDEQYRDQELQRRKIGRDQKRKALEEDPLHVDARKDADRMVKVRRLATETQDVLNTQDREEMIEKVHQR